MADYRLINGDWVDLDFGAVDDIRLINGAWVKSTATASALIAGSATASITETDVVNGTKTITITLTGDTWIN